jgi:diguanylate cyclase (GGDEF)-like protein
MLKKINQFFKNRNAAFIALISFIAVILLAVAEYFISPQISFSIFYLFPIALAGWYGSPGLCVIVCAAASALWLTADISAGHEYAHAAIPFWNAIVRLVFFVAIGGLLMRLHRQLRDHEQLSSTDALTGLANRRSFLERARFELERLKRYKHPFTLAYINLDNFKAVNDSRGHAEGDMLLKKAAHAIQSHVRHTDVVSRLGGDEFAAVLSDTGYTPAREAIRKVHGLLTKAMNENGWPVTFSIGVISFEAAMSDIRDVVKMADDLMYEVKKSGKNRIDHRVWNGKELKEVDSSGVYKVKSA